MLRQLYDLYTTCLDVQEQIIPSLEEKALACTKALCHLYYNRILRGCPVYGFLGEGRRDYDVFQQILERTKVDENVLVATTKLFVAQSCSLPKFRTAQRSTCGLLQNLISQYLSEVWIMFSKDWPGSGEVQSRERAFVAVKELRDVASEFCPVT